MEITQTIAQKVIDTVSAGLVSGLGRPEPGKMCVEAAVCYALGLPHSDDPKCVSPYLRSLKIRLNDSNWSSNEARSKGLLALSVAQLGSVDVLDEVEFKKRVKAMTIGTILPIALRAAASVKKYDKHKIALEEAAVRCEKDRDREAAIFARNAAYTAYAAAAAYAAADAADAAAYAAYAAAVADAAAAAVADAAKRDEVLNLFASEVVKILIDLKAPGCQWLSLVK